PTSPLLYIIAPSPTDFHTLSLHDALPIFRGREFDESGYAQQVAEYYGTEHHELDLNPSLDLAGAIEEMAYHSDEPGADAGALPVDRKSTRLNSSHVAISYAVFCLKKKKIL